MKPQIFDWLGLLDTNVVIILGLMVIVAVINMITAILILIFERTNMIGLLKALGSSNRQVRNIFLWKASYLILKGLFWGNLVALGLGYLQIKTGFFPLDAESYYLHQVPFYINPLYVLLINGVTFLLCLLMLLLPARIISRISPVKAIRFE
jgi:lipoprotein-releasing system permease protein